MTVAPEKAALFMSEAERLCEEDQLTNHFPVWVEQLHKYMKADQQLAIVIEAPTQPGYLHTRPGNYIQTHNTGTDGFGQPLYWAIPMHRTRQHPREVHSQSCVLLGIQEPRGGLVLDRSGDPIVKG